MTELERKRVLRLREVQSLTGLSRTQIYVREDFPQPIRLGPNTAGWLQGEVLAWLDERIAAREAAE